MLDSLFRTRHTVVSLMVSHCMLRIFGIVLSFKKFSFVAMVLGAVLLDIHDLRLNQPGDINICALV